ncbi:MULTISPECIES: hypothetical protein [Planktothricoides]|uniref:Transposase n=2 Tax=Planktothricoides raciborskii TaxID=132608 RepID=A0AAU8JIP6_9CYAN|nr:MULTISPECIES: hypothetical protein [Planktothricoides]MBD2546412.1 hypothetical protein [Planktothricoides raciborskii FACHB-1370]MBD2584863.1 hypothetical protein [Planktothricoides raciborskii FACHB-1261]
MSPLLAQVLREIEQLADYRLRVYRRFPHKRMVQVVVYLKPSNSPLVRQDYFRIEELPPFG